jgi:hypothetical protein
MNIIPVKSRVELLLQRQEQLDSMHKGISEVQQEVTANRDKAVFIAASLLLGYFIISRFYKKRTQTAPLPNEKGNENVPVQSIETNSESPIVSAIKGYIISFLLSLARQKIQQFLNELYKNEDGNDLQRTD